MLVEGQGYFVLPNETSHNLVLDPYLTADIVTVFCYYNESGAMYTIARDRDDLTAVPIPNQGVQVVLNVPNGDYTPSVEGTYTCSVRVNGQLRGTRDTIVSLPGKFCMQHACISCGQAVFTVLFGSVVQTGYLQSVICYRPGDIIMVATTLVQTAAIGTRKTGLKCIRMIQG